MLDSILCFAIFQVWSTNFVFLCNYNAYTVLIPHQEKEEHLALILNPLLASNAISLQPFWVINQYYQILKFILSAFKAFIAVLPYLWYIVALCLETYHLTGSLSSNFCEDNLFEQHLLPPDSGLKKDVFFCHVSQPVVSCVTRENSNKN